MTSPAAADLVRSRKPGEVGARFAPASRVKGEGASGTVETPRVKIYPVRQCLHVSVGGPETHTPTLSLVRERASGISLFHAPDFQAGNSFSTVSDQGEGWGVGAGFPIRRKYIWTRQKES